MGIIGNGECIKRSIIRKRRQIGNHPNEPTSLNDINVPESLRTTFSGENFVLYDKIKRQTFKGIPSLDG